MLMTLIRSRLQGRELKPFSCAQVQDHLRFIDFTSERDFCLYVHSMNRTYAYLRNDRKIKFRIVSAQHFINEALCVCECLCVCVCASLSVFQPNCLVSLSLCVCVCVSVSFVKKKY